MSPRGLVSAGGDHGAATCARAEVEDPDIGAAATKSHRTGTSTAAAVQDLTRRADLLASRGRYAQALELVEAAIRLDPRRADLHLGFGQCLLRLERLGEAREAFEKVRVLAPQHILAGRGLAAVAVREQRWTDAATLLREALALEPLDADLRLDLARCLTEKGVTVKVGGQPSPQLFYEALEVCEAHPPAYFQLGVVHSEAGEHAQARQMYTKAVQINPGYLEAWNNLGVTCRHLSDPDAAVECYRMALKVNPQCSKTRENMAISLLEVGCRLIERKELKEASSILKQALSYNMKNADIYFNLGVLYAEKQKWDRARVNYELATHFDPKHATAWNNLGVIHRRQNNGESALHCFEQALQADAKMPLANKNLGALYCTIGRMADSVRLTRVALEISPTDPEAHNNLALVYRDRCDVDACIQHLDACLLIAPDNPHANSNRLMTLNYPAERSREDVFNEHKVYGERLESRIPPMYSSWKATGGRSDGVLRVGYMSPDFHTHSVSYFIHSALRHHDPAVIHVTCYSDVLVEDDKTRLFKSYVPCWRTIAGMCDEDVARLIYTDSIDILVELTGHTGNNRLSCLALRPAPVIVTWMGYPHTTGLTRVDFRISDEKADPPDLPGLTTEQIVYLPGCFLCYTPSDLAPPVARQVAQETYGCPTFGCFNNLAKISSLTVRLWCRVLHEVPDARLFLKAKAFACSEVQERFRRAFSAHGIDGPRLDFSGLQAQTGSHLQMYSLVDVALDTAPYAGTTTTCEALYMGVPVVTLRGRGIHAQSVGASLLSAVQLDDLVADTEDEYVRAAASLATNVKRLGALRAGLRTRMERSHLCDGPKHTARLERLFSDLIARPEIQDRYGGAASGTAELQ